MIYTADYLIEKRREKWNESHDIEFDKQLRKAIAKEIVNNPDLRAEVQEYPEKLVELQFIVVDKEKKTQPFFLNDVQLQVCL